MPRVAGGLRIEATRGSGSLARGGRQDTRGPVVARGAVIVVAGPDGAGKSTLCDALIAELPASTKVMRVHHRPGVLPVRGGASGSTDPRASTPYPRVLSALKTWFLFVDYRLGWTSRIKGAAKRGELVLIERGWWDLVVDPERYRLRPSGLASALGRWLPRPDATVVLEAPPEVMSGRKDELPPQEIARQSLAWREVPSGARPYYVDATRPPRDIAREVLQRLAGAGSAREQRWLNLPTRRSARWYVPTDTNTAAAAGFAIHQPMSVKALVGWKLTKSATRLGLSHIAPKGDPPPRAVTDLVRHKVPAARHLAVARAHDRSRYVCLAIDDAGSAVALAKVDVEEDAGGSLQHEADALGKLGGGVTAPLLAPTLIDSEPSLLLFEPILWRARLRPWHLPADVAAALGRFYAPAGDGPDRGATHGDFAPWNLLRTGKGWVLIDWEEASEDGPAFFDLWHYLVQSHVLLGRPNTAELARGMAGDGWVSEAVNAYTQAAGLERDDAVRSLVHYLSVSRDNLDPNVRHADKALRARLALLDRVKDL